jgi:hypothetical protein
MSLRFAAGATRYSACRAPGPARTTDREESFPLALSVNEAGLVLPDSFAHPPKTIGRQAIELLDNGSRQTRIADFGPYQELPFGLSTLIAQASPSKGRQSRAQIRDRQRIYFSAISSAELSSGSSCASTSKRISVPTGAPIPVCSPDGRRGLARPGIPSAAIASRRHRQRNKGSKLE